MGALDFWAITWNFFQSSRGNFCYYMVKSFCGDSMLAISSFQPAHLMYKKTAIGYPSLIMT